MQALSRHTHSYEGIQIICILLTIALFGFSCRKQEEFTIEPQIELISFTSIPNQRGIDEKGRLVFSFKDKDGDIGLEDNDTNTSPFRPSDAYYHNCFISYFKKENGSFNKVIFPGFSLNMRLPFITPEGNKKSIKGEIEAELFINDYQPNKTHDTIYLEVYIVDRALHESNVIQTDPIVIRKY